MESNSHPIYLSSKAKGEELLKTAKEYTYWEYEDLSLKVYSVGDKEEGIEKPAIIFLHGGAWDISSPEQFIPHCHHFRDGGAVCFTAEYRGALNGMTNPLDAAEDVRNLIVWIRENANIFGVAVNKIVLVGAASGGHAALSSMRRRKRERF